MQTILQKLVIKPFVWPCCLLYKVNYIYVRQGYQHPSADQSLLFVGDARPPPPPTTNTRFPLCPYHNTISIDYIKVSTYSMTIPEKEEEAVVKVTKPQTWWGRREEKLCIDEGSAGPPNVLMQIESLSEINRCGCCLTFPPTKMRIFRVLSDPLKSTCTSARVTWFKRHPEICDKTKVIVWTWVVLGFMKEMSPFPVSSSIDCGATGRRRWTDQSNWICNLNRYSIFSFTHKSLWLACVCVMIIFCVALFILVRLGVHQRSAVPMQSVSSASLLT